MKSFIEAEYHPDTSNIKISVITAPKPAPASITSITTSVLSATYALPAVLSALQQDDIDAIVIACFSAHPLVNMLRELTAVPVVGIMEAGIIMSSQVGGKTGIVTTDKRWEPLLEHEIEGELGLSSRCRGGVWSSSLSVLELEELPKEEVQKKIGQMALRMVREKEVDVILLGCAGMVGLDRVVQNWVGSGVTVVDPVMSGVEMALSLARMRLKTAKAGRYEMSSM
jgi:allantoin racemase